MNGPPLIKTCAKGSSLTCSPAFGAMPDLTACRWTTTKADPKNNSAGRIAAAMTAV